MDRQGNQAEGRLTPRRLIAASRAIRERLRIPDDAVLFGAFGLVTPEKRIGAVLRALAGLPAGKAHLLLAGGTVPHYDAMAEARALGIEERVHLTGYVAEEELPAHVQAADVCLCLRWPTGGETSAIWLRAIAAGKPTVVTDLAHAGQAPTLEPQAWSVLPPTLARPSTPLDLRSARPGQGGGTPPEPVSISIDILDEDRLLALAVRRLAADGALREALGRAARRYLGAPPHDGLHRGRLPPRDSACPRASCRTPRGPPRSPAARPARRGTEAGGAGGREPGPAHLTPITTGGRLNCRRPQGRVAHRGERF